MSAINIPDMVRVLKHHNLKIVPLDISIETCAPKVELIEHLVTERTVAILVAHIYGKWCDMEPIIKTAERHKLTVIEDCAESFSGFERIGHPKSDLALFSFGAIKFFTAFGGAIAKVSDPKVHQSMKDLYKNYPYQSRSDYINRVLKYSFVYILLNCPRVIKSGMYLTRLLGIDHKKHVVKMLRGFPSQLMRKIRHQPSGPLLAVMYERMQNFHASELLMAKLKGDYVSERLPTKATQVGTKAAVYNYWLFPIIVVSKAINDNTTGFPMDHETLESQGLLQIIRKLKVFGFASGKNSVFIVFFKAYIFRPYLPSGAEIQKVVSPQPQYVYFNKEYGSRLRNNSLLK